MAEAARSYMASRSNDVKAMSGHAWGNAYTRSLLGVRLGIGGSGNWSMVKPFAEPPPVEIGDRAPDGIVHDSEGRQVLHDLFGRSFVALYFTDTRRRPDIPETICLGSRTTPCRAGMRRAAIRDRSLLDAGGRLARRYGCAPDTMVLVRPDDHVAAIAPMSPGLAQSAYRAALAIPQRETVPA